MAVKQLKQHDARNDIRFLREIAILKECRSGHVVQFLVRLLTATYPSCGAALACLCLLCPCTHAKFYQLGCPMCPWTNPFGGMEYALNTDDGLGRREESMASHGMAHACRAPAWRRAAPCWCAS